MSRFPHDFANAYFFPYQDYFRNFKDEVGPVKMAQKISRGTWRVKFVRADGAKKAYEKLTGLFIDKKPIVVSRSKV